jgi:hypothetical protein
MSDIVMEKEPFIVRRVRKSDQISGDRKRRWRVGVWNQSQTVWPEHIFLVVELEDPEGIMTCRQPHIMCPFN